MSVTLMCEVCGRQFEVYPSRIKLGKVRFCSRQCKGVDQSNPVERTCEVCNRHFTVSPGKLKQSAARFCSKGCMSIAYKTERLGSGETKVTKKCKVCDKKFRVVKSKAKQKFCSHKCSGKWKSKSQIGEANPNWHGGTWSYPPEFNDKLKQVIRCRDQHACKICDRKYKKGKRFPVHHIDYNKQNNCPNNLITLCHTCHAKTNANREYWRLILSVKGNKHDYPKQLRFASF